MNSKEYARNEYPSFGKKYDNEIGVISLTSWKARINTVTKTLFSLLKQCPKFHIVLVLAEEEFPKMISELPENLQIFVENELIEIMFVKHNYWSFKKVLFAMDKYRDAPVISADDDCIYVCNYAQTLYDAWLKHKDCIITNRGVEYRPYCISRGPNTLFTYDIMKNAIEMLKTIFEKESQKAIIAKMPLDDDYYSAFYHLNNVKTIDLMKPSFYKFQNTANNSTALHNMRKCSNERTLIEQFVNLLKTAAS